MSSKASESPLYLYRGDSILTLWLEDKLIHPDYQQSPHDAPCNELPGLIFGAMSIHVILGLCGIYFQNLEVGLKGLLEEIKYIYILHSETEEVCPYFVLQISFVKGKAIQDLALPQQ